MKNRLQFLLLVAMLCACTATQAQRGTSNDEYRLVFDYTSRKWTGYAHRNQRWFLVPYKTQQRIVVKNVPGDYTVEMNETSIAVTFDEGTKGKVPTTAGDSVFFLSNVIESDEMEYTVIIKDDKQHEVCKSTAFVKVFRGLKIDVSTGVVFHTLADNSYHYTNDGSVFTLTKDNRKGKLFPISPVVLTHAYFRSKGFVSWGGTLGFGINDSGKLGYYLGLASLIGDRQRIVLSAGAAFRPVSILKSQYDEGQVFADADKPDLADVTEDQFRTGFFFSVSYNLTSKVVRK